MNKVNLIALALVSCGSLVNRAEAANNVLLIIADDIGSEVLSVYGAADSYQKANTPNIDMLAQRGVVFNNFWTSSLSSPTRAMLMTGKYGFSSGVVTTTPNLSSSEQSVQKAIGSTHATGLFGKWHLTPSLDSPQDYGIDHFAGYINGGVRSYNDWVSNINGVRGSERAYAPTQITDWAKEWIEEQNESWFCWVAYPSAHTPYHTPPKSSLPEYSESSDKMPYFIEMIEAMDDEIGRLIEGVDMESTTVIFISDNGSSNEVYQGDGLSKGSMTQAGINTALIVAGAGVERVNCTDDTMVSAVDIYPTIIELSGNSYSGNSSGYSIMPLLADSEWQSPRKYNFSDVVSVRRGYMNTISDGRYKLISVRGEATELYDLRGGSGLSDNLLNSSLNSDATQALNSLKAEIKSLDIPDAILNVQGQGRSRGGMRNGAMRQRRN